MLNKYSTQFKSMYDKLQKGESVHEIILESIPLFEKDFMRYLKVRKHFKKYITHRNNK